MSDPNMEKVKHLDVDLLCPRFVVLLGAMQCLNQAAILLFVSPLTTGEIVINFFIHAFHLLMFSLFDECVRHTGLGSDPGLYPDYILALHSSKRLLAEQLSSSYHLLVIITFDCISNISMKEISQADSIISLTVARGQRHEGREGMTAYYLTKVIAMMMIKMVMTKVMMIMMLLMVVLVMIMSVTRVEVMMSMVFMTIMIMIIFNTKVMLMMISYQGCHIIRVEYSDVIGRIVRVGPAWL